MYSALPSLSIAKRYMITQRVMCRSPQEATNLFHEYRRDFLILIYTKLTLVHTILIHVEFPILSTTLEEV